MSSTLTVGEIFAGYGGLGLALGISRTAQLRLLGNGVVPQQAAHALAGLTQWAVAA